MFSYGAERKLPCVSLQKELATTCEAWLWIRPQGVSLGLHTLDRNLRWG